MCPFYMCVKCVVVVYKLHPINISLTDDEKKVERHGNGHTNI